MCFKHEAPAKVPRIQESLEAARGIHDMSWFKSCVAVVSSFFFLFIFLSFFLPSFPHFLQFFLNVVPRVADLLSLENPGYASV